MEFGIKQPQDHFSIGDYFEGMLWRREQMSILYVRNIAKKIKIEVSESTSAADMDLFPININ